MREPPPDGRTHWEGCEAEHHDCALARLEDARARIAELEAERESLAFMYRSAAPDDPTGVRNAARIKAADARAAAAEAQVAALRSSGG